MKDEAPQVTPTPFGFTWGPAIVERISDGPFGVIIGIHSTVTTKARPIYVRVSLGGKKVEVAE